MSRVYVHELVDIVGHARERYQHHVTANWSPIGQAERAQLCFGVWGVVGSTGRWPQVVNLWEYRSWADLARNFEVELATPSMQDPSLAEWWAAAAEMRSGGVDRVLIGDDGQPGIEELCAAGGGGVGYLHELVGCTPGAAPELLASVRSAGSDAYRQAGLRPVGRFARAMADDDEVVLIWAFDDWSTWGRFEAASAGSEGDLGRWRRSVRRFTSRWERTLLVDAALSPLRTGRQPRVEDRR